ncbi:MAG: type II toxin-antitoxin system RelE/ParE family toxin, partial [Promethearchaeia archaeon]
MVTIKWTELAKEDLKEIIDYLSQASSQYGEYFRSRVFEEIENIRDFPLMGRKVPEFDNSDLRELLFQKYRII